MYCNLLHSCVHVADGTPNVQYVLVITWPRRRWLIYHTLEGAKRPRCHVITGLLQFEILLCRIITERTRPSFLWISANAFLFGKTRRNAKACGIKSDLFINNDVFQTGYEPKTFFAALTGRWKSSPERNAAQEETVFITCFSSTEQFLQF